MQLTEARFSGDFTDSLNNGQIVLMSSQSKIKDKEASNEINSLSKAGEVHEEEKIDAKNSEAPQIGERPVNPVSKTA